MTSLRNGLLLVVAAIAGVTLAAFASGGTATSAATPSFYLSPSGNDAAACTQAAPCKSLNRAYQLAAPGQTVEVAAGSYPAQTISASSKTGAPVTFVANGAASFGHVDIYGNGITYEKLDFASGWTVWDNVARQTFLDTTGTYLYIFGGHDVSVIGGAYGNVANTYSFISATGPGAPVPANILIDGVRFHDVTVTGTNHTECLHAVSVQGLTIRNSRFERCAIMDVFLTINPNSSLPFRNVVIEDNFFGRTIGGGFYSLFVDARQAFENVSVRFNSFAQVPIFEVPESGTPKPLTNFVVDSNLGEQWGYMCNPQVKYSYNVWFDGARPESTVAKCSASDTGLENTSDPGWVNQAAVDLHLKAKRPGNPSSYPAADIDGQARTSPPDVGADEVTSTPPPPPPTTTTSTTPTVTTNTTPTTTTAPPPAPVLKVTLSSETATTVTLGWNTIPGATGYRLYKNGALLSTTGATATSARFSDRTWGPDKYTVTAIGPSASDDITLTEARKEV